LVAPIAAIAYHPGAMGCPSNDSVRLLASAPLVVLLAWISTLDAAETNVCTVVANPSGFEIRELVAPLVGSVTWSVNVRAEALL
jgi:hypothetical protein